MIDLAYAHHGWENAPRVVTVECEPRSKARVRFADGRAYSDRTQREYEELLRQHLRPEFSSPLPGNVGVAMEFFRSTAHRIDLDNLVKAVLDAANGVCWIDDQQVTAISARLELDRARPRTIIAIAGSRSSLVRGGDEIATCKGCGVQHIPRPNLYGYHSVICYRKHVAHGRCAICKKPLQKRAALLCQQCWLTKAAKETSRAEFEETGVRTRGKRGRSSSRRGVSLRRDTGKWAAYTQWDGRRITLGSFATEDEAISALDHFEGVKRTDVQLNATMP